MKIRLHAVIACLLSLAMTAFAQAQSAPNDLSRAADLFRQGKLPEAEAVLRALSTATPPDAAVLNLLGAVFDARKNYDEAEKSFRRALDLAPNSAAVLNNLGNHYLESGKPDKALDAFQRVVAADPAHQNANLQLAKLLTDRGQGKRALENLARLKLDGGGPLALQLLRARALHQAGRESDADAMFAKLESTADGAAAWYSLGLAFGEANEYARAETAFTRALEATPRDLDILHNLGLAAMRADHADRAQQVFETMLHAKPDDPEALFQLGSAIAQQERYEDAMLVLVRARKLAPKRIDILRTLAITEARAGYFGDSALVWNDLLQLQPEDEIARRERGFANACAGNKKEALADLEWYVKKHPQDPAGHFQLGVGLSVSDHDGALSHLNEAIRIKPDFGEAHLVRGSLFQSMGKPTEAVGDLEFAVAQRPEHIRAISLLGRVYLELERPADAVRVLRSGYKLAPRDSQILMALGRALIDTGEDQEGERLLEEFAKIGPDRSMEKSLPGRLSLLSLPPDQLKERYEANLRSALRSRGSSDPEIRGQLARFLMANGRREEAIAEYRGILSGVTEAHILFECGHNLIEANEYALARDFLANALEKDRTPAGQLDFVVALLGLDETRNALTELDRVAEGDRNGDYYLLRAQVYDALGNIQQAAASLNQSFQVAPTRADLYEKAVLFLLKHDMDGKALDLIEQATKLLPDEPNLLLLQTTLLALTNRTDEALALLRRINGRWPEWSRPYLVRGIIQENHAQSEEALKSIETAMLMGEKGPEAYYYLAQSLANVDPENIKAAQEAIAKAIQLDPNDPWAHALAGRLAWQASDFNTSARELRQAIQQKKDFVRAHFWLGATYRSMGEEAKANAQLAEVEKIHERNPQAEAETGPGVRDRLFRSSP